MKNISIDNDEFDELLNTKEKLEQRGSLDARLKVENYREQRRLDRLINYDFDYLDDGT